MDTLKELLEMTPEELMVEIKAQPFRVLEEMKDYLLKLNHLNHYFLEVEKCKQLQMVAVDIDSIATHLKDLWENGPLEPWLEVALEDSEIQDEFEFPMVQEENAN